ncbi:MAG TPA: MEDS domain-containing protein [Nitrososphaeraceae archaeon]|nr:MEDS domain-containing protein [Nitrososphaeraceae archaeon]
MKSMRQENNYHHSSRQMLVKGTSQKIAKMMVTEKKLIEPGSHNLLIYNEFRAFREIYSQYSSAFLPENEIIVIGTQYDAIYDVKHTLRLSGINVERYLNQGTLFIVDAQRGYQQTDSRGLWKLAMSLISRVKKEGRKGVTWFGDLGSFLSFEKIDELMQYELWCPRKYQDMMKTVCCYHSKDFEKLNKTQQQILFDHHFKSILIE